MYNFHIRNQRPATGEQKAARQRNQKEWQEKPRIKTDRQTTAAAALLWL